MIALESYHVNSDVRIAPAVHMPYGDRQAPASAWAKGEGRCRCICPSDSTYPPAPSLWMRLCASGCRRRPCRTAVPCGCARMWCVRRLLLGQPLFTLLCGVRRAFGSVRPIRKPRIWHSAVSMQASWHRRGLGVDLP